MKETVKLMTDTIHHDTLRAVIRKAIASHSSLTIGRGDVHGGQPGHIVYEPFLGFIEAEIIREVDRVKPLISNGSGKATETIKAALRALVGTDLPEFEAKIGGVVIRVTSDAWVVAEASGD